MRIWKFTMPLEDESSILAPGPGRVLTALTNPVERRLLDWYIELDESGPEYTYPVEVIGTGNPFQPDDNRTYLGSIQNLPFVWHLYAYPAVPRRSA